MACSCAPALLQLRKEINTRWPDRDKASDGCCGDAAHAARKSDHNPTDGYAHALDIDENLTAELGSLDFLVPILLADSRTKYVIYEGRIHYPPATSKVYTGVNAHKQHLHLSIKSTATFETRPWLGALDKPTPPQEADMTSPATVSYNGKRWVFVHGTDHNLWGTDGGGTWVDLGGDLAEGSSPDAEAHDGGIDVVVTGKDATVWGRSLRGGAWSPWWAVPGKHKVS